MKKAVIFVLAVLLAGLVVGCTQMNAGEIVKKAEEKYDAIKDMKGTVVVVTNYHGKKKVEEIRFAVKKPDKFWQERENYTIVSNGKMMWIYNKNKNEVIKINMPKKRSKFDYGEFIKDLLKDNKVKLLGTEKVAGRECYVIEAIPKNKSFYTEQKL